MTGSLHSARRAARCLPLPALFAKYRARPYLWWSLIALTLIVGRIAVLPWMPPPEPVVPDEFSYLLAADTFAHGRTANAPPKHPEFFEAPHVLAAPVYISKYPPGQGLVLAIGQRLTGNPYWGVVLSVAGMLFVFCWAANAWLPSRWTLVAGILSLLVFLLRDYWISSYWGGAVAASGGALVAGGLGYALRGNLRPVRFSLGLGAVVLYASRPYEGGILCLTTLVLFALQWHRLPGDRRRAILKSVLLPNAAIVVAAMPLALCYNASVTGNPFELPYTFYQRQADLVSPFWIVPPFEHKQYSTANVAAYHDWEQATHASVRQTPLAQLLAMQLVKFATNSLLVHFMAFPLLLLLVPWTRLRNRKHQLLILFGAGLCALMPEAWVMSHYGAPFMIVTVILMVAAGRTLWHRLAFTPFTRAIRALVVALLLGSVLAHTLSVIREKPTERARLARKLASQPGRDLVLVDYAPGWDYLHEWVYNGADLAASPVIFAHDLGINRNRALIEDFPGRIVWRVLLGPKQSDVRVERYMADALSRSSIP